MRQFTIYASAKLNLYLDILEKRFDGYHNIETFFEKVDLKDEIIIKEKDKGIEVKTDGALCPPGKKNIVYKALEELFKEAEVDLGLEIFIKKNIPVAAGLGGGSSDAAAVIRAVNERFNLGMDKDKLFSIAHRIGKDVPFFILDKPFAIGRGTGERLEEIKTDLILNHLIIKPGISISTKEMYKRVDIMSPRPEKRDIKGIVSAIHKKDIGLIGSGRYYYNIFEHVLGDYIRYIKKARLFFSKAGIDSAFLSGSGPSVFCIFKNKEEAIEASRRIPKIKGWQVFVAQTAY